MSESLASLDIDLIELRPRMYRLSIPLPNNPLKALNSYIFLEEDRTLIIDVGFNHPLCADTLNAALKKLGRNWESVEILLTHSHSDHTGCLDRIYREGMTIYANMHSFQEVSNLVNMESREFGPLLDKLTGTCSLVHATSTDDEAREQLMRFRVSSELLPLRRRESFTYLRQGDVFEVAGYTFEIIATPGHDSWHICLYEPTEHFLIAGDAVLERISPVIMSWMLPHNALDEFLESLRKLDAYEVDVVYAGHGRPFSNYHERIAELIVHHEERLKEIYGLVRTGHSDLIDITSRCQWKYPNWYDWEMNQKYFSLGEVNAHLIYLVHKGLVEFSTCGTRERYTVPDVLTEL